MRSDITIKRIADAMRWARPDNRLGGTIFFIGAGCSISAGIPGVPNIAQRMCLDVARRMVGLGATETDPAIAYGSLFTAGRMPSCLKDGSPASEAPDDKNIDWYKVYDAMFEQIFYETPDDVRRLFGSLVADAQGAINWAHLCIGEIVKHRFISTVITTNFDQLVLSGMTRAGVLPAMCDGVESLNRISSQPLHPQLIELHGSRYTYLLRNRPADVAQVAGYSGTITAIESLLHHAEVFVVVGYGGRENGVMDLLVQAAKSHPDKRLYWVAYDPDPKAISAKARDFLMTTKTGGVLGGQDADAFFLELCAALEIGVPSVLARPLQQAQQLLAELRKANHQYPDIKKEIELADERVRHLLEVIDSAGPKSQLERAAPIRAARLAGQYESAHKLALEAVSPDNLEQTDSNVTEEAALAWFAAGVGQDPPQEMPLEMAVRAFEALLQRLEPGSEKWAFAQYNLGNALAALGDLQASVFRLEKAVAAYQASLSVRTRERAPLDWAETQHSLGTVLWNLGELNEEQSELVSSESCLRQAEAAFRAALEVRVRTRLPLDWAESQFNLANVLSKLGEMTRDRSPLDAAVTAYRAVQAEYRRDRLPVDWAMCQFYLGDTLYIIGDLTGTAGPLQEAATAYRSALEVLTPERNAREWGAVEHNLGSVLWTLADSDPSHLQEAEAAFRLALRVRTRDQIPLEWAATQYNMGGVLTAIGQRTTDPTPLRLAIVAYRSALEEYRREERPDDWAATQFELGNAQFYLGKQQEGTALQQAVEAYAAALGESARLDMTDRSLLVSRLAEANALLENRKSKPRRVPA